VANLAVKAGNAFSPSEGNRIPVSADRSVIVAIRSGLPLDVSLRSVVY
jgi:hypothetical protein